MKNSEHHTIKSLKLWENHHNTHTGGGGGVADMDPPSRSAAESSRVFFFSLWTYSPRTGDLLSRVEVDSLTDWLHGAFR